MYLKIMIFVIIFLNFTSCKQKGDISFDGYITDKSGSFDSPGDLDFGSLTVDETFQLTKILSNHGDFDILIKEFTTLGLFSIDDSSTCVKGLTLKSKESCSLVVNVSIASLGEISEMLTISYYDGIEKDKTCTILLSGTGVPYDVYLSRSLAQDQLTNSFPVKFEVNFSSQIDPTSFSTSDITQSGTATGVSWTITSAGDNKKFYLYAISASSDGTIIPSIDANSVINSSNIGNGQSTDLGTQVIVDTVQPEIVSIVRKNGASEETDNPILEFRVTFSEAVFNLATNDFLVSAPGITYTLQSLSMVDEKTYDITISVLAGSGYIFVDWNDTDYTVSDLIGNNVNYDFLGPSLFSPEKFLYSSIATLNFEIAGTNSIYADGTSTTSLRVTALDSEGNPAISQRVRLNIPTNGGTTGMLLKSTDINGQASWTLTSSITPGSYLYFADSPHSSVDSNSVTLNFLSIAFITTWDTENTSVGSSNSDQITIPLVSGKNYNFSINWGDGSTSAITAWDDADKTHTYASSGVYQVRIGTNAGDIFEAFLFQGSGDRLKLLSVDNWGKLQMNTMEAAFQGCENIVFNALDTPDLSMVTSLKKMFKDAINFNSDLNSWDTSNVTDLTETFMNATSFNGLISDWDTSSVTLMIFTFSGATSFNQDLNWNTSSVEQFTSMFRDATNFNSDISAWDMSSAQYMGAMFLNATSFNQNISSWNTSNVINMMNLFYGATSFNQDLSGWDVGNVTTSTTFDSGATNWIPAYKPALTP